jgi:hypothetical protein
MSMQILRYVSNAQLLFEERNMKIEAV